MESKSVTFTYSSYEYNVMKSLLQWIDNPILLKPKYSFSKSSEVVVLLYEITVSYQDWQRKPQFDGDESLFNPWWIVQIRNTLLLILGMERKNICHGHMNETSSYVIVGDALCVVNPTQLSENSLKDLTDFKRFLIRTRKPEEGQSRDWEDFLSLFPTYEDLIDPEFGLESCIKQLCNHPLLKGPEERFHHFRLSWDLCLPHGTILHSILNDGALDWLRLWNKKIFKECGVYMEVYQFPNASITRANEMYNPKDLMDLGRYIRNLIKYYRGRKEPADIENELRDLFPGYLSYFYSCCAKADPPFFKVIAEADSLDLFLLSLKLKDCSNTFHEKQVDMARLMLMTEDDLEAFGIPTDARKKILRALEVWKLH